MIDFKTITAPATAEFTIQRSRFITHTFPVKTEEEAQDAIRSIKKKYYDARHSCSAFIIGEDGMLRRSNDDGEPSGTAGAPILDAIERNNLTNILIVVTRYFGGIKLGTGGLTRAYSHAAVLGIESSPIAVSTLFTRYEITISYTLLGSIENYLRQKKIRTEDTLYAENVSLILLLTPTGVPDILNDLTDLTANTHQVEKLDDIRLLIDVKSLEQE